MLRNNVVLKQKAHGAREEGKAKETGRGLDRIATTKWTMKFVNTLNACLRLILEKETKTPPVSYGKALAACHPSEMGVADSSLSNFKRPPREGLYKILFCFQFVHVYFQLYVKAKLPFLSVNLFVYMSVVVTTYLLNNLFPNVLTYQPQHVFINY